MAKPKKPKGSGTKKPSGGQKPRYRRADNGQYTTPQYAARHPRTTIRENR